MASDADRMARIARVRTLQKQLALAQEARQLGAVVQARELTARVERLRDANQLDVTQTSAATLKAQVHQRDRIDQALVATRRRQTAAEAELENARAATRDAHQRQRIADELTARAEKRAALEEDRRAERLAPPARR